MAQTDPPPGLLQPALPMAAPGAGFDLRAPGFVAYLRTRYGDTAAPCADSPLTLAQFCRLYQCADEATAGRAWRMVGPARVKWSAAWMQFIHESGL